jgi:hypothetical protein
MLGSCPARTLIALLHRVLQSHESDPSGAAADLLDGISEAASHHVPAPTLGWCLIGERAGVIGVDGEPTATRGLPPSRP